VAGTVDTFSFARKFSKFCVKFCVKFSNFFVLNEIPIVSYIFCSKNIFQNSFKNLNIFSFGAKIIFFFGGKNSLI